MSARLIITLDEAATEKYLARAREITAAHVNADCEPPGVTLTVEICPPYGCLVSMGQIELGEAEVEVAE